MPLFCSAIVAPIKSSTSSTSSLGGLKSVVSSVSLLDFCLVVERMPFLVLFMCPLAVAVDSGRYFRTKAEVMRGKPISWSLSMALHSVSMVGEKRHWWRKVIVSAMVEVWKALLPSCRLALVSSTMVMLCAPWTFVSGMYHSPLLLLLSPLITSTLLCITMHSLLLNSTLQPWSHNFVTEMRVLLRPWMM